jgi:uncharacterized protein YecE (DUF72 family)
MAMVEKWRKMAPRDFEFTVKAHKTISHETKLDASDSCLKAFEQTKAICDALKAKIILLQTAASFTPDKIDVAERFFHKISLGDKILVWETRGPAWEASDVRRKLAGTLRKFNVSHVTDPFVALPVFTGDIVYFRLHGLGESMYYYQYTDKELEGLHRMIDTFETGGKEVYVLFNNLAMFDDAVRFKQYLQKGMFPKITGKVGLESIRAVIERTRYPISKAVLLKRFGWRLVELEEGKQIRLGQVLEKSSQKTFESPEKVLEAAKTIIKS